MTFPRIPLVVFAIAVPVIVGAISAGPAKAGRYGAVGPAEALPDLTAGPAEAGHYEISGPAEAGHYVPQRAGAAPTNAGTTARVVTAANTFLAALNDAQRMQGMFAFDSPQRTGWSNLPSGIFRRNGLRLGDLTPPQRSAALALVAAALSREGYEKVTNIMNGDEVLRNAGGGRTGGRQGGGGVRFGRDEYY